LGRFQAYAISNHLGAQMKNHRAEAGLWMQRLGMQRLGMQGFLQEGEKGGNHRWAGEKFKQNRKESSEHRIFLFSNEPASSSNFLSINFEIFRLLIFTSNLIFHERETSGRLNRKSFK
jgi:hypothetical protein